MLQPDLLPGMKNELIFENPTSLFDGCILRLPVAKSVPRYRINRNEKVWDGLRWTERSPSSFELYFNVFGELYSIVDPCSSEVKDTYDIVFRYGDNGEGYIGFARVMDWFYLERLQYGKLWTEITDVGVQNLGYDLDIWKNRYFLKVGGRVMSRYLKNISMQFEVNNDSRDMFCQASEDFFISRVKGSEEIINYRGRASCNVFYIFTECCFYGNNGIFPCFGKSIDCYCDKSETWEREECAN